MHARRHLIIVLLGSLLALPGCATPSPVRQPRIETTRDLALVSVLGEESGARVTAVNGIVLGRGVPVGRKPADAPAGLDSNMGIWLPPGLHTLNVQYVHNIEGGISFSRGEVPVTVSGGRTYIVRPVQLAASRKVSFAVVDHGTGFPLACLPASISAARPPGAHGQRPRFSRADIQDCQQRRAG